MQPGAWGKVNLVRRESGGEVVPGDHGGMTSRTMPPRKSLDPHDWLRIPLDVLEEQGLVESRYELVKASGSKRSVPVRMSVATPLAEKALKDIADSLREE
jgi:hypothetical protein